MKTTMPFFTAARFDGGLAVSLIYACSLTDYIFPIHISSW